MDLDSGCPYWLLRRGLRTVVPPLDRDLECDVAVIGSGITGAITALTLAEEGLSVVMLDRRDAASGSTMASTAMLQYDLDVPLHKLSAMLGWERAVRAFRMGVDGIEQLRKIGGRVGVAVERTRSLHYVQEGGAVDELAAELESRQRAGLNVCWVDRDELEISWGVSAEAAILSIDAAQVDPYALTHALIVHGLDVGVAVHDRTAVLEVSPDGRGVVLQTDRGPRVRAEAVVHATGYEGAPTLPLGKVQLRSTYALVSEPIDGARSRPRCMLWEYGDPYLYSRWVGDRVLIGGEDAPLDDVKARDRLIPAKTAALLRKGRALLPDCPVEPAFAWCGTFATTEDGIGYIGALPGRPRELFAFGFGGNGVTFSALAAGMLRDHVVGVRNEGAELFRLDR